jgi:hypothetical protein
MKFRWLKPLFIVAAVGDVAFGVIFLFFPGAVLRYFDSAPPEFLGYIQFPALLIFIFAAIFFRIALDPVTYRFMIWYGVGEKAAFAGLVFWYYFTANAPWLFMPLAMADVVFLALFAMALQQTKQAAA